MAAAYEAGPIAEGAAWVRKSRYGPLRCDRCGYTLPRADLRALHAAHLTEDLHLGCLTPIEQTRLKVRLSGTRCLFCGARMLLPALVDHFNLEHGRVIANW